MKQLFILTLIALSYNAIAQDRFLLQEKSNLFYISHKVTKGESIYQIARDYHIRPSALLKFNDMGNETAIKYGQNIQIPLLETNFFKMGGLAEENGYSPVVYKGNANESLSSLAKKHKVSESTLSKWNGGASSYTAGESLIVGWIKNAQASRSTKSWAQNNRQSSNDEILKPEVPLEVEENGAQLEENTSATEAISYAEKRDIKAEKEKALNPRFIDPNAPKPQTQPSKSTYNRNYSQGYRPVKKEAVAIKDDSQDAWYAVKRLFGSKNKKKENVLSETNPKIQEPAVEVKNVKNAGQYATDDLSVKKPTSTPPVKTPNRTYTRPAYTASKPASKPKAEKASGESKSKNLWNDFTSIFKSKKQKSNSDYTTEVAEIKPVRKDPNRTKTPKAKESKTKELWADLKSSFRSDKESASPKYTNYEAKAKEVAPIKASKANNPALKPAPKSTPAPKSAPAPTNPRATSKPATKVTTSGDVESKKTTTSTKKAEPTKKEYEFSPNPKSLEKKEEALVVDPVVRNEIKSLNLSRSSSGRASYFFGGPSGGKFYVATNLAAKGQVVKVVNPDNGKFVMAEVISSLPSSDAAKGILLKLSDNAKLPLGQRNGSFNVKVNY